MAENQNTAAQAPTVEQQLTAILGSETVEQLKIVARSENIDNIRLFGALYVEKRLGEFLVSAVKSAVATRAEYVRNQVNAAVERKQDKEFKQRVGLGMPVEQAYVLTYGKATGGEQIIRKS